MFNKYQFKEKEKTYYCKYPFVRLWWHSRYVSFVKKTEKKSLKYKLVFPSCNKHHYKYTFTCSLQKMGATVLKISFLHVYLNLEKKKLLPRKVLSHP